MDFYENDLISLYLSKLKEIESVSSSRQKIQFYLHPFLGKVLIINGEIQHIEKFQCLYHEMLVHLPLSFIRQPKKALVIGGGSLFAASELLKYYSFEKVDLCDYDPCVINLMKKYYPHAKSVLNDKRFKYIDDDAKHFLDTNKEKYDVIINDCFNIVKEDSLTGRPLSDTFLETLTEDGVCSDVIYRHIFDKDTTVATLKKMQTYMNVCFSLVAVPEYPGVLHIEVIWGKNKNISQKEMICHNKEQKNSHLYQYYNSDMLPYYLYIPPYIENMFTK